MSCHDIGRGMDLVVGRIMETYREGRLDRLTAMQLIATARKAVHYCDGNEGEAVECMTNTCGCCLRDGKPGEQLYSVYGGRWAADGKDLWPAICEASEPPETERDMDYHTCSRHLCAACFERIFDRIAGLGAGATLREDAERHDWAHTVEA